MVEAMKQATSEAQRARAEIEHVRKAVASMRTHAQASRDIRPLQVREMNAPKAPAKKAKRSR